MLYIITMLKSWHSWLGLVVKKVGAIVKVKVGALDFALGLGSASINKAQYSDLLAGSLCQLF
jgi:hypothetical protein